jgi:hypothetical protein
MNLNSILYIRQECEWEEINKRNKRYIKVYELKQGRVILLTSNTCKIWKLIDKGYKIKGIIKEMEKGGMSSSEVMDTLNYLYNLKLVASIDEP